MPVWLKTRRAYFFYSTCNFCCLSRFRESLSSTLAAFLFALQELQFLRFLQNQQPSCPSQYQCGIDGLGLRFALPIFFLPLVPRIDCFLNRCAPAGRSAAPTMTVITYNHVLQRKSFLVIRRKHNDIRIWKRTERTRLYYFHSTFLPQ